MKVLILNGSPHLEGNTTIALGEMVRVFMAEGIETEIIRIGNRDIRGCIGCGTCSTKGSCVFDDIVNELAEKFREADGLVVASPVYYASANATLIACLDRLFYSTGFDKRMKVGAAVVVARRGGASATFDELNKYFLVSGMPVAASQYWNSVHGNAQGDAAADREGLQTMRSLAHNMSFLMKSIALGREQYGLPEQEEWVPTHFIRRDLIEAATEEAAAQAAPSAPKRNVRKTAQTAAVKAVRGSAARRNRDNSGAGSASEVKPSVLRTVKRAKKAAEKQETAHKKAEEKRRLVQKKAEEKRNSVKRRTGIGKKKEA